MTLAAIDTYRIVKRLTGAGFTEAAAETVTDVLRETRATDLANLATKDDVERLGQDLRKDMQLLEQRITVKLGGMLVVAIGVVAAMVKLL